MYLSILSSLPDTTLDGVLSSFATDRECATSFTKVAAENPMVARVFMAKGT
jgi:hypothetical protein